MPAFQLVPHPQFSPTACVTCGTSTDPDGFIDLLVDTAVNGFDEPNGAPIHSTDGVTPTIGHLYLCCTCLYQAATAAGCLDPTGRHTLETKLEEAEDHIVDLTQELEVEQANKLVPLTDLQQLLGQHAPAKKAAA